MLHVMLPRVREFYAIEQLWERRAAARERHQASMHRVAAAAPAGRSSGAARRAADAQHCAMAACACA